jgi:hypothetical protein
VKTLGEWLSQALPPLPCKISPRMALPSACSQRGASRQLLDVNRLNSIAVNLCQNVGRIAMIFFTPSDSAGWIVHPVIVGLEEQECVQGHRR